MLNVLDAALPYDGIQVKGEQSFSLVLLFEIKTLNLQPQF